MNKSHVTLKAMTLLLTCCLIKVPILKASPQEEAAVADSDLAQPQAQPQSSPQRETGAASGSQPATTIRTLPKDLWGDVKHLPSVEALWIAAAGGATALAVHPVDGDVNPKLANIYYVFHPGAYAGNTATLYGIATMTWAFGALSNRPRAAHIGLDLIRSLTVTEAMVESLKYTVRRERPDHSSGYSFPSGHSADTFAFAAVIQRHHGIIHALPVYLVASYVAASRLHDNVHYLSDVVFGAAVGTIGGRDVTRHGKENFALIPIFPAGGGRGVGFVYNFGASRNGGE